MRDCPEIADTLDVIFAALEIVALTSSASAFPPVAGLGGFTLCITLYGKGSFTAAAGEEALRG